MNKLANILTKITPEQLSENPFSLFSKEWILITGGNNTEHYNTMTASWGGLGVIWNKNIATVYIRPQRYTYEFIENGDIFTISLLPEGCRDTLAFCGKHSGRDCDKAQECGLTPIEADGGVSFSQARLVLVCKKLYHTDIDPNNFADEAIDTTNYPEKDYHRLYMAEIISVYQAQ